MIRINKIHDKKFPPVNQTVELHYDWQEELENLWRKNIADDTAEVLMS